jgi:hypothetical protein
MQPILRQLGCKAKALQGYYRVLWDGASFLFARAQAERIMGCNLLVQAQRAAERKGAAMKSLFGLALAAILLALWFGV